MRVKTLFLFAFCILHFSLSGQSGKQLIHVPGDHPTIQEGINAAQDGDVVLVDEGLYYENINFKGKAITVASLFWQDGDTNHINNTIISGAQPTNLDSNSVVYFISGEDNSSVLSGFTITNGTGTRTGNDYHDGGGIFCDDSAPVIEHNDIVFNESIAPVSITTGGGIFVWFAEQDTIIIRDNFISNNISMTEITVGNGSYPALGGGIYAGGSNCIIENNVIANNLAHHGGPESGSCSGGGMQCELGYLMIRSNHIYGNTASNSHTGWIPWGGGLLVREASFVEISDNLIDKNVLSGGDETKGGGLGISLCEEVLMDGNIIKRNMSTLGGGLSLHLRGPAEIFNNVFLGNNAFHRGGAIRLQGGEKNQEDLVSFRIQKENNQKNLPDGTRDTAQILMVNNNFAYNTAWVVGGAIDQRCNDPLIAFNNIFYENWSAGNTVLEIPPWSIAYLYNNDLDVDRIWGTWKGEDNFYADPLFDSDTIHLQSGSLCIDSGLESLSINLNTYYAPGHDIDNQIRPQNNGYDIGADEKLLVGIQSPAESKLYLTIKPNPVSGSADIRYLTLDTGYSNLSIYDACGRLVEILVDGVQQTGEHIIRWNAENLPSGIYIYRLTVGNEVVSEKIIKR